MSHMTLTCGGQKTEFNFVKNYFNDKEDSSANNLSNNNNNKILEGHNWE